VTDLHLVPESKANDLLITLVNKFLSKEVLNDIEFATFKRKCLQLPTGQEQMITEVLTFCAANRFQEAKELALEAIRHYGDDDFVSSNIIWAMIQAGKPTVAYEAVKNMPLESTDAEDVHNIITTNLLFNDVNIDNKINDWLIRTQQHEFLKQKNSALKGWYMIRRDIEKRFAVSSDTINQLSVIAAEVVEQHEKVILNNTLLSIPPESPNATLTVFVECEPEKIFDLNWDLSGALVDAELDDVRCIPVFELLRDSTPTFAERII
jgi:hypothetical protein